MSHNLKTETGVTKDKNLVLISNNSADIFDPPAFNMMLSRNSSLGMSEFRRNSSHNNLLPAFTQDVRPREEPPRRQEHLTDSQRYAQECLEYEKYTFDEKIRLLIHRISINSYHNFKDRSEHTFLTFFIERFLCTLAKKLLLNRFELLFLSYICQDSKWKYDNDIISSCALEFKPFVHIPESENPNGLVKNLQVYLLFCAYNSKRTLNDIKDQGIYNFFLNSVSHHFKDRYNQWTEVSGILKNRINPKILNILFKKLNSFQDRDKEYFENYNLLVEEILEISPAYNADKENKKKRKKRKVEQEPPSEDYRDPDSNAHEGNQPIQSLPPPEESPSEFPAMRKKPTSYVENLNGLDPTYYANSNYRNI